MKYLYPRMLSFLEPSVKIDYDYITESIKLFFKKQNKLFELEKIITQKNNRIFELEKIVTEKNNRIFELEKKYKILKYENKEEDIKLACFRAKEGAKKYAEEKEKFKKMYEHKTVGEIMISM